MALIPIVSLLFILGFSLLITRIATVALIHTGMGREMARFQSRSAFTGVGFTTTEAESVLQHPVRRKIVMWLMLVGNVGIVTATASLLLSAVDMSGMAADGGGSDRSARLLFLLGGLALLLFAASSRWVDRYLSRAISWALRRFTTIDVRDYASLLHLRDDYGITELVVNVGDWLVGRTLGEARIAKEGVLVLGLQCPSGGFVGAPAADTGIRAGDTLIVYGRSQSIAALCRRAADTAGDAGHHEAVAEQDRISRQEHARAGR